MPDYTYSPFLVLDATTGTRAILAECKVTDPDTGNSVILKNLNGTTLGTKFRSGTDAMAPWFVAPIPEVMVTGGGVSIRVGSFAGVLAQAQAATASALAAQQDGVASGAVTGGALVFTRRDGSTFNVGSVIGPAGAPGNKQQTIDALIAAGFLAVRNEMVNPSAEINTASFSQAGGSLSRQTASPPAWISGAAWLRLTADGTSNQPRVFQVAPNQDVALTAGQWAGVSANLANAAGYFSAVGVRFFNSSFAQIGEVMIPYAANTGGRVSVAAVAPANTATASFVFKLDNAGAVVPSGVTMDIDAIVLTAGATESELRYKLAAGYFDGNSAAAYWLGTTGASKSVTALPNRVPVSLSNGVDFNTLTAPGRYAFNNLTGQVNSPPMAQMYGEMEVVYSDNGRVVQTVYPTASQAAGRAIYQRSNGGGTWLPWYVYAAITIDTTAGRNIQLYDYVSNSQRTIAGKTGVRVMNASLTNGWAIAASNNLTISRSGDTVTVMATGLVGTSKTSDLFFIIPPGFRPDRNNARGNWSNENTAYGKIIGYTNGEMYLSGSSTAHTNIGFGWVFETADAWPTVLPGV